MEKNREIAHIRKSLFDTGILGEQFVLVEQLGDDNPRFLESLLTTYFEESSHSIAALENALKLPLLKYSELERTFHKFKGASASIGALRVSAEMDSAIVACREKEEEGIKAGLERIKVEYTILRRKLGDYFGIMRQAGPSDSAVRPK